MKRSEIVARLANLASKAKIEVTPANVGVLAKQSNELFEEAATLINDLEAEERKAEEGVSDDS